jgi:hypothetical protein
MSCFIITYILHQSTKDYSCRTYGETDACTKYNESTPIDKLPFAVHPLQRTIWLPESSRRPPRSHQPAAADAPHHSQEDQPPTSPIDAKTQIYCESLRLDKNKRRRRIEATAEKSSLISHGGAARVDFCFLFVHACSVCRRKGMYNLHTRVVWIKLK